MVAPRPWIVELPDRELSTFIPDNAILRMHGDRVPFRSREDAEFAAYAVNNIEEAKSLLEEALDPQLKLPDVAHRIRRFLQRGMQASSTREEPQGTIRTTYCWEIEWDADGRVRVVPG